MDLESIQMLWGKMVVGNTLGTYFVSLVVFLGVFVGLRILRNFIIVRIRKLTEKTATQLDDLLVDLISRHVGFGVGLFVALYLSTRSLILPSSVNQILRILFVVFLTIKGITILQEVFAFLIKSWVRPEQRATPGGQAMIKNMTIVARLMLWLAGILFVFDNLGINVTAFVAGLGIGGVAIALAAQTILGDAFSSFAIFMDKPFEVGDFIIVGDLLGTVEYIGFKTTRIRSLGGEQLIFSNSDLTGSRIRNYKRMKERRVVFQFGVIYETSTEKVKAIPGMVESVIKENKLARLDRVHFHSYGDFALTFEVVYYVLSPDYNQYMDTQQFINFRLKEEFEKEAIVFAYPTQQLYVTQVTPSS